MTSHLHFEYSNEPSPPPKTRTQSYPARSWGYTNMSVKAKLLPPCFNETLRLLIKIVERRVTKMKKSESSGRSAEKAGEVAGEAAMAAETKAETLEKRLQERVRADPIKAILIAAGVGLLVGLLL